jgi:hypothetical protein
MDNLDFKTRRIEMNLKDKLEDHFQRLIDKGETILRINKDIHLFFEIK